MDNFYNGGLWGNFSFFCRIQLNFFPGYIKNVDTHHESFSSKKQEIIFKLELGESRTVSTNIMLVGYLLMCHAFEFDLNLQVHRRIIQFKVKGV